MRREDLARAVAEAVLSVPGVAGLHPGFGVEVATLFSGGKITGVRLSGPTVEVYIIADRAPLRAVAEEVVWAARRVLSAAGDDRRVDVVVADVVVATLDRRARVRDEAHAHR